MTDHAPALLSFVTNRFGEHYLYEVNRNAFNTIGAEAVFGQFFGKSLWEEETLYILLGSDSGLLIEYIQRHGLPPGSRYLFVEPTELLPTLKARYPEGTLDEHILLTDADHWIALAKGVGFENYFYLDKVRLVRSVGGADANLFAYRELYRQIFDNLQTWTWGLNAELGSNTFFQCQLANAPEDHTPAMKLRGSFRGKTAVLLAGGPSLDSVIPWAKRHRDQVAVFAVSRVCRRLLQEGLVPDIVFSIDPTALSFDISKELLRFDDRVLLVNAYHVHPALLGQWPGRNAYLGERLPWPGELNPENIPVTGPTVTNTAIAAAIEMGFAQIVFGGVDLCFSPEGYTHAQGSNEHKAGPALGVYGLRVRTNSGEMAETETSLSQAIHDIGRQAQRAAALGCRFINGSPNAAAIPGVLYQPLDEVGFEPLDEPAAATIARHVAAPGRAARRADLDALEAEFLRAIRDTRAIRKLAEEALECNDGLFGRGGKQADFKYKVRMDKIERRLDREFKDLAPLAKRFGIRRFIKLVRVDEEREWQDDEVERTGRLYYEAYVEGADALLKAVENALERVRARKRELDEQPDVAALAAWWREERQPGRGRVLLQRRPELQARLGAAERAEFERLEQEFEAVLNQTETVHMRRARAQAALKDVRSKALTLFMHNDTAALARLAASLEKSTAPDAPPYRQLVSGYLAELNGDEDAALSHYQAAGEGERELLEDALRRISTITLNRHDFDSAVATLDCLSHLSVSYLPQLAELHRLRGDLEGAVNAYASYVEQVPDDFPTLLKLGDLYLRSGVHDGARWVFNYILERDPANAAARTLLQELDQG